MPKVEISTVHELQAMAYDLAGDYVLVDDIDASETETWHPDGAIPTPVYFGFYPVGIGTEAFTGTFDGAGHVIKGLYINRAGTEKVGLFGHAVGATIEKLGMEDCYINGRSQVGTIVGWAATTTIISCCYALHTDMATSMVDSADGYQGGIAGSIAAGCKILNCWTQCCIQPGGQYVGGVVGRMQSTSEANDSWADVVLLNGSLGAVDVGGFVGEVSVATSAINRCYAVGLSNNKWQRHGGFAGSAHADSHIVDCWADVDITPDSLSGPRGGFIGRGGHCTGCYAFGDISHGNIIGGFVGDGGSGTFEDCVAMGNVGTAGQDSFDIGGFVGELGAGGWIQHSWCTGEVKTSGIKAGGFVGEALSGSLIDDSRCEGSVASSNSNMGGFVGDGRGDINRCLTISPMVGTPATYGPFTGRYDGTFAACFWNTDIQPVGTVTQPTGILGQDTAGLQDLAVYQAADPAWSIELESLATDQAWALPESPAGYPFIRSAQDQESICALPAIANSVPAKRINGVDV